MKPRTPTAQEVKEWRESNRFTRKKKPEPEAEPGSQDDLMAAALKPPARKGHAAKFVTPVKEKEKPALAPLTTRDATKRLKSYPDIDATLDLHGMTKLEAYAAVKAFITRHQRTGKRHLLIITGKGRIGEGILRTELPHWLNEPALRPLISAFTPGRPEKGGNGVTHVLVKKYRE